MNRRNFNTVSLLCFTLMFSLFAHAETSEVQDGFYVQDETGKSKLHIKVHDTGGKRHQFSVVPYTNLAVKSVSVFAVKNPDTKWQVQLSVIASEDNWSTKSIALVVNGKTYLELFKYGTVRTKNVEFTASVSIVIDTEAEAKVVAQRLRKRFKVQL